jgi:sigma-E factor negative regulatory protein RseB
MTATTWAIAAAAGAGSEVDARQAAELLGRTRTAPERYDFEGDATVTWSTESGVRRARVRVTGVGGAIEIVAADGKTVVDEGRRTYLRDRLGWTGVVVEPSARTLPAPGRAWALSTAGARTVAGRPTTSVVAARPGGTLAQRVAVDDATGLLLAREVLGPDGAVQRSVRFSRIEITEPAVTPSSTEEVSTPSGVHSPTAKELSSTPDGYRAPDSPAGFELLTRSQHADGVLLSYSDGVFTATVFEQRGALDWRALPDGGSDSQMADTRTRTYREPSGDVAVWERDGLVFTCVTDAPSDRFEQMVAVFSSGDRSTAEAVVDFVLSPFGWG